MKSKNEITFSTTMLKKPKKLIDHGYTEKVEYLSGTIEVEADGEKITVYNQGTFQGLYTVDATGVHHSKMKFPNVKVETAAADADISFYPFSILACDKMSRTKMKKGKKSAFHYHNGRTARLVLKGTIKMEWIQNNSIHTVTLEEDDWMVIPANVPYRSTILDEIDMISNWVCDQPIGGGGKFAPQLNTIGHYIPKG